MPWEKPCYSSCGEVPAGPERGAQRLPARASGCASLQAQVSCDLWLLVQDYQWGACPDGPIGWQTDRLKTGFVTLPSRCGNLSLLEN